jgi:hypothetical protein
VSLNWFLFSAPPSPAADLDAMYTRFMFNMVPIGWEKAAYPSLKPLASWVEDLILRVDFMNKWLTQGAPPAFWLSGFFFPQGFMTAVLQVYSRKHRIAIDTLKFRASVLDRVVSSIVEAPESGALTGFLFLFGSFLSLWSFCTRSLIRSLNLFSLFLPAYSLVRVSINLQAPSFMDCTCKAPRGLAKTMSWSSPRRASCLWKCSPFGSSRSAPTNRCRATHTRAPCTRPRRARANCRPPAIRQTLFYFCVR